MYKIKYGFGSTESYVDDSFTYICLWNSNKFHKNWEKYVFLIPPLPHRTQSQWRTIIIKHFYS